MCPCMCECTLLRANVLHICMHEFASLPHNICMQRLYRDGPDRDAYYHELFLRGKPELVAAMTRVVSPGKRKPK